MQQSFGNHCFWFIIMCQLTITLHLAIFGLLFVFDYFFVTHLECKKTRFMLIEAETVGAPTRSPVSLSPICSRLL